MICQGNEDPNYFSAMVIKNFVCKHLGFQNAHNFACKFEEEPWSKGLMYLIDDVDSIQLITSIQSKKRDTMHVYVEDSIYEPLFIEVNEPLPRLLTCETNVSGPCVSGLNISEGDLNSAGVGVGHGVSEEVADGEQFDREEADESGSEGDTLGDENLTNIELTNKEELKLWQVVDSENVEELTKGNWMFWFGGGIGISRDAEEVPEDTKSSDDVLSMEKGGNQNGRNRNDQFRFRFGTHRNAIFFCSSSIPVFTENFI